MVSRHLVLLAFILVSLPYVFAAPVFEKSDEVMHFAFIHHLANGGGLPVQSLGSRSASLIWRRTTGVSRPSPWR